MSILDDIQRMHREIMALKSADGATPSLMTSVRSGVFIVPQTYANQDIMCDALSDYLDFPMLSVTFTDSSGNPVQPLVGYRESRPGLSDFNTWHFPVGASNSGYHINWTVMGQSVNSVNWYVMGRV